MVGPLLFLWMCWNSLVHFLALFLFWVTSQALFNFTNWTNLHWEHNWWWIQIEATPLVGFRMIKFTVPTMFELQIKLSTVNLFIHSPWLSILMSLPVWTIVIASFANSWSRYVISSLSYAYLKEMQSSWSESSYWFLKLSILIRTVVMPLGGQIADFLHRRITFSDTVVRYDLINSPPWISTRYYKNGIIFCIFWGSKFW